MTTFTRSTSLSSFVKQLLFLGPSSSTSTSTSSKSKINDTMNGGDSSVHIGSENSIINNSSTYERCLFHQEYVSFPSLDELDEQYKEPSRFMLESQTVVC